ncbi:MAG: DUF1295 domain-containing protein [Bacteroidales bacterium]
MISPEFFTLIVWSWIGIALLIFPVTLTITAPYGRHSKTNWGPMINNNIAWVLMEIPSLLVFSFFIIKADRFADKMILIAFMLWVIHYTYRAIIFPIIIKTKKKKMPVAIMLFAVFFNLINGFINGYWFGVLSPGYSVGWFSDPRFVFGALLFLSGFVINQYHDKILLSLRKPGETGYKIPKGGLFKFISCPNFFGEIIEWGGFALMTWCLPSLSFFVWTFANLVPRAIDHHKWYLQNFDNYPSKRKAVFPFLF